MEYEIHAIALLLAVIMDWLLGDPAWIPHPIVAMGKSIAWFEKCCNRGKYKQIKGGVTVFILTVGCYLFFTLLAWSCLNAPWWVQLLVETLFCFTALAGTTLIRECRKVFVALESSLDAGRKQVGYLVGRDTTELTAEEVKTATLETLAENLSDGVVAPLFWFCIGGLPAMMTYKMINTQDSMLGYKTARYKDFGKCAALLDDAANWLPARITAFTMALVTWSKRSFQFILKYGRAHSSPNAGYPEAALAGILNVQFGGGHWYHGEWMEKPVIGDTKRKISKEDLKQAIRVNRKTEIVLLIGGFFLLLMTLFPITF